MTGAERVKKWRDRVRGTEEYKAKKKIENAKRRFKNRQWRIDWNGKILRGALLALKMRDSRIKELQKRYYQADWACRVYKLKLAMR